MNKSFKLPEKINSYRDLKIISRNEKDIEIVTGGNHIKKRRS
jgi:hypothetical protein